MFDDLSVVTKGSLANRVHLPRHTLTSDPEYSQSVQWVVVPGVMGGAVYVVGGWVHRGTAPGHHRVTTGHHRVTTGSDTESTLGPTLSQHWVRHWVNPNPTMSRHWVSPNPTLSQHWANTESYRFINKTRKSGHFDGLLTDKTDQNWQNTRSKHLWFQKCSKTVIFSV